MLIFGNALKGRLVSRLAAEAQCTVVKMLVRRGDLHGLEGGDGAEAEWARGYGWEDLDTQKIRNEYFLWALECHNALDNDCAKTGVHNCVVVLCSSDGVFLLLSAARACELCMSPLAPCSSDDDSLQLI